MYKRNPKGNGLVSFSLYPAYSLFTAEFMYGQFYVVVSRVNLEASCERGLRLRHSDHMLRLGHFTLGFDSPPTPSPFPNPKK